MHITVYVWKLASGDEELLSNIIEKTLEIKEFSIVELQDSKYQKPHPEEILLCFGARAFNLVSAESNQAIKLPGVYQLYASLENTGYRHEAWSILKSLKESPPSFREEQQIELKPEDLAINLTAKSRNLIKHIQEDRTEYWVGTTASGKKVAITNSPNFINTNCNFQITFEELYAARLAVDLLGLKSLVLVKEKKDD
jgi:hypothetical protein